MGLNPSPHDSCILSGVITNPSSYVLTSDIQYQLHVGLFVDDFIFYLSDPAQEECWKNCYKHKSKSVSWDM